MPQAESESTVDGVADRRLALSPAEVARAIGASPGWVALRIADGSIPSAKVAGRRFIRPEALAELLGRKVDDPVALAKAAAVFRQARERRLSSAADPNGADQ